MPKQVIFALFIEVTLMVLTSLLLTRPSLIFTNTSSKMNEFARVGGMIFLCVMFCWSVILGCVLTLNSIVIRL